jgi:hypothetical protein
VDFDICESGRFKGNVLEITQHGNLEIVLEIISHIYVFDFGNEGVWPCNILETRIFFIEGNLFKHTVKTTQLTIGTFLQSFLIELYSILFRNLHPV